MHNVKDARRLIIAALSAISNPRAYGFDEQLEHLHEALQLVIAALSALTDDEEVTA